MPEILSQDEIDDLLNENLAEEDSEDKTNFGFASSGKQKIFKPPKKDNSRFKYEYRSPIIKKDRIIYNPKDRSDFNCEKVIVRSLANYALYLRRKKM